VVGGVGIGSQDLPGYSALGCVRRSAPFVR
jgi:hypothetical protein